MVISCVGCCQEHRSAGSNLPGCARVQVTGYSNVEEELSGHASEVPFSVEDRIASVRIHDCYRTHADMCFFLSDAVQTGRLATDSPPLLTAALTLWQLAYSSCKA